ncbi:MAG: MaoC family dehydratase [Pseudomonadota bacterium]|nr:MaoC family dehydratase [Pseudomonadota bacterium]
MPVATLAEIQALVGREIGVSPWIDVPQTSIDNFADVTGDHQFIHVDAEAAAQTPFGGTIAHGFLTLSLLSQMGATAMRIPDTAKMVVNYGFDKVRFIAPVKSGARVRGRFTLSDIAEKRPGQWQIVHAVTVEIEGEERAALQADWIGLIFT